MACVKRDTIFTNKKEEVKWFFWQESMKQPETWREHLYPNKKTDMLNCFECSNVLTDSRWINPVSYEIILDKIVQNIYCKDCYNKWIETKIELGNSSN